MKTARYASHARPSLKVGRPRKPLNTIRAARMAADARAAAVIDAAETGAVVLTPAAATVAAIAAVTEDKNGYLKLVILEGMTSFLFLGIR